MAGTWIRQPTGSLPDGPVTVIFVHGILSSARSCWTHENGTYWPELLAREPNCQSVGVYSYEYKTGFLSGTYSISDVVDDLQDSLRLDRVNESRKLIFVCHSMGGIVARKYILRRSIELVGAKKELGLFLIASPSLGSSYANWIGPLARVFKNTQADILRFSDTNTWLGELDNEFLQFKEADYLTMRGVELVEDRFIPGLPDQVVKAFSARKYFGGSKIRDTDHFSIAKVSGPDARQHELLLEHISKFLPGGIARRTAPDNTCRIRFSGDLNPDLVSCQVAVNRILADNGRIEVEWPSVLAEYQALLEALISEAAEHYAATSTFHGCPEADIASFASSTPGIIREVQRIRGAAPERAKFLVRGMNGYWRGLDNIHGEALANFFAIANYEMLSRLISPFRTPPLSRSHYPRQFEDLIRAGSHRDAYRRLFDISGPVANAKLSMFSGRDLPGIWFWGPKNELLDSLKWRPGDAVTGTWIDKYLIPQNEFRLIGTDETFAYNETLSIIKVADEDGREYP